MSGILQIEAVQKTFREPAGELHLLKGIDLTISSGEIVLLQGPSGSGKTTLLQISGCLTRATVGRVCLAGQEVNSASDSMRTKTRQMHLGFAFQSFHLLDALSVWDNVALGLRLKRQPHDAKRIDEVIGLLGIGTKAAKLPRDLSGGEKQRVAFARALVGRPSLLLADEPTSQLDTYAAEAVAEMVRRSVREFGCAALITTHDSRLHPVADRILNIKEGKIYEQSSLH